MFRAVVAGGLALATVLLVVTAGVAWRRQGPGADLFTAVAAVAGVGAAAIGTSVGFGAPPAVALGAAIAVGLALPVPWLLFSFRYTGRPDLVSSGVAAAVGALPAVGVLATGLIFGARVFPWVKLPAPAATSGPAAVAVALLSLVQWLALLYAGGLVLVGSGALLWTFHRYRHLDRVGGTLLGVFGTVPWLSILFGVRVAGVDPLALPGLTATGFLTGGLAAVVGLQRRTLFRTVPAAGNVGPATVVSELEDVVIVTDATETVVEVNAAERALGLSRDAVVGAAVETVLDVPLEALEDDRPVGVRSDSRRRLFDPTVSELTDQHGRLIGHAIVLRDVTTRRIRQQRLSVLNRVLRHNLRNEMTVILGHADRLEQTAADPETADSARAIATAGRSLTSLGEQARAVERLLDDADLESEPVRLAPVVTAVVNEVTAESDPPPRVEREVPPEVTVRGPQRLLRAALSNLVANAIEHNDAETPWVAIRAEYDPDRPYPVHLTVADDGPGIPPVERRTIEQGDETALEHGSGLGLWVVRWTVMRLGGELAFADRSPRGTAVTLRLPGSRRPSGADASATGDLTERAPAPGPDHSE